MQYIKNDVQTLCIGQAASMGAFLLMAGKKGKRFALPNARILIHQPLIMGGGIQGQATEIDIHAREILRLRERMNRIMAEHTGQSFEQIERDTDRDFSMGSGGGLVLPPTGGHLGGPPSTVLPCRPLLTVVPDPL